MSDVINQYYVKWNEFLIREDKRHQIQFLLDGQNLVLFFLHNDMVFGATDSNRLTFATMKIPGDDQPPGWKKEASFKAINLTFCVQFGRPEQRIFYYKDIPKINVLSKEQAFDILSKNIDNYDLNNIIKGRDVLTKFSQLVDGDNDEQDS